MSADNLMRGRVPPLSSTSRTRAQIAAVIVAYRQSGDTRPYAEILQEAGYAPYEIATHGFDALRVAEGALASERARASAEAIRETAASVGGMTDTIVQAWLKDDRRNPISILEERYYPADIGKLGAAAILSALHRLRKIDERKTAAGGNAILFFAPDQSGIDLAGAV